LERRRRLLRRISRRPVHVRRRLIALLAGGLVLAVVAGVVVARVTRDDEPGRQPPSASGGDGPQGRSSFLARLIPPPPERVRGPRAPRSIADLARRLPAERKVAQLFLWGFSGQDLTAPVFRELRRLDLGGIVIAQRNYRNAQQLANLAGEAAVIARAARHVPPFVMAAQEGGEFNAFPDLPPAQPQARIESASAAARSAFSGAASLRPLGVNGVLGPVADVGPEDGGVLGARAYSDDPETVASHVVAAVGAYRRASTLSAVGHFPGLGGATQDTEEGPASVGLTPEELGKRDLVPFLAAVRARVPAVVVGNAAYATDDFVTPASLSRKITTDLLRGRLGFDGVAITDDLAAPAVTAVSTVPDAAVDAVKAGADMVFISAPRGDQEAAYLAVLNALRRGDIPRRRVNEAILRILEAKAEYRLISTRRRRR
jgi:beta-N-acetylhexosaminidase